MIELAPATMIACESPTLARGTSPAAAYVFTEAERARKRLRDSYSLGWGGEEVFAELDGVVQACSIPGWDGYHALPIEDATHALATDFLKSLPLGIPVPAVSADSDGQITLEWHLSPRKTVSVSVSQDGELHFAALNGGSSTFGTLFTSLGKKPTELQCGKP